MHIVSIPFVYIRRDSGVATFATDAALQISCLIDDFVIHDIRGRVNNHDVYIDIV